jgi:wyosine [tRNA(Phe)-imidazoG37] synthetase (radical SAM superfamily)
MKNLVFGPVPSRRLGFSLGIDIVPYKYCSFDCIYCQLGRTTCKEIERTSFAEPDVIVRQVIEKQKGEQYIDFLTVSGSGEPTLNRDIGWIITELKKKTSLPIAVITNGSLLYRDDVRQDLARADVVLPSLDAPTEAAFQKINCPHPALSLNQTVWGLKAFRREYGGAIWLEIMLINNLNNDLEAINIFKNIISNIAVDKIQLNTVNRPPADVNATRLDIKSLDSICNLLGPKCEAVRAFDRTKRKEGGDDWAEHLLDTLKRRSLSLSDVIRITGVSEKRVLTRLAELVKDGKIKKEIFHGTIFYISARDDAS